MMTDGFLHIFWKIWTGGLTLFILLPISLFHWSTSNVILVCSWLYEKKKCNQLDCLPWKDNLLLWRQECIIVEFLERHFRRKLEWSHSKIKATLLKRHKTGSSEETGAVWGERWYTSNKNSKLSGLALWLANNLPKRPTSSCLMSTLTEYSEDTDWPLPWHQVCFLKVTEKLSNNVRTVWFYNSLSKRFHFVIFSVFHVLTCFTKSEGVLRRITTGTIWLFYHLRIEVYFISLQNNYTSLLSRTEKDNKNSNK